MAIYHLSSKSVSRSGGRSAVAAIAYRTASLLVNERDGLVHDFTAKQGVDHCEIVLPDGIDADWARDRSALWNGAEAAEKRCDARVAREVLGWEPRHNCMETIVRSSLAWEDHLAERMHVERFGARQAFAAAG